MSVEPFKKTLSVSNAASLCGVSHGTVGYWIRSKNLRADRVAKNYEIPVEELLFFLKSRRRKIPKELAGLEFQGNCFRTFKPCWQYWEESHHGHDCRKCPISVKQLDTCFTAKDSNLWNCRVKCSECQYYLENYLPRIHFIHQLDVPAVVCKGLNIWGGNKRWAKLSEVEENELVGMGIEQIVHSDSLETLISKIKKIALGSSDTSRSYSIFLKNNRHGKTKVRISTYLMNEPLGSFLVMGDPDGG